MPLYTYECPDHGQFDAFYRLAERADIAGCPKCGQASRRIIALGHGGIFREEPTWLDDSVRGALQDPSEKPIETRSELKKWLKDHPNVAPVG